MDNKELKIYMITHVNNIHEFALMIGDSVEEVSNAFCDLFYGGKYTYVNVAELGILTDKRSGRIIATNMRLHGDVYEPPCHSEGADRKVELLQSSVRELSLERTYMQRLLDAQERETKLLNRINDLLSPSSV